MRVFKFPLYPTKDQQNKLWSHANRLNKLYNYFLDQRIEAFKFGVKIDRNDQQLEVKLLRINDPILKEIHSQVACQPIVRLDQTYQNFFRRIKSGQEAPGFPKFRACQSFFGICYPQPLKEKRMLDKSIFNSTAYGQIPFNKTREIKGNIKQLYITTKNNKWYLCVTTDYSSEKSATLKGKLGIDIGLKWLVVGTNEQGQVVEKIRNTTDSKYFDKQIANLQSRRSKLTKGSRQYKYLTSVIQRLYELKVNKINDFQHKVSKTLGSKYDTIFTEDLTTKKMSEGKATGLNKSIRNAKLSQFLTFLQYKTNNLILVNPKNTSKTCNDCGKIHKDLKLSDRTIECECGLTYDRDENAARNVFCLGQATQVQPAYIGSLTIQEALTLRLSSSSSPTQQHVLQNAF